MAYCDQSDILKAIPEATLISLTDDEATGLVNAGRVTEAITKADSKINGYCEERYEIPFDPVPDLVNACSVDITIYNLYTRVMEDVPDTRVGQYKEAVRLLEKISAGTLKLGVDVPKASETSGAAFITGTDRSGGDRLFTRKTLKGM